MMPYPFDRQQCQPNQAPYIIQPGDTFYKLAQLFKTTVAAIIAANPGVNPNNLKVGQEVCIPGQLLPCSEGNYYSIRPGDTLYRIARFFNISMYDLIEANPGINPNRLQVGQIICVPLATPPVTCPPNTISYIIQPGDTFYHLAERYNTTVAAIIAANPGINPNALLVGQRICIPTIAMAAYTNPTYGVTFWYPSNWRKVDELRYEGSTGFFQISAIGGGQTLEQVCRNEAFHKMEPYGSNPTITRTIIQGNEGCYIFPSGDQPIDMREQAALIVRYPRPVTIAGRVYDYFILWADQDYIRAIGDSLRFI